MVGVSLYNPKPSLGGNTLCHAHVFCKVADELLHLASWCLLGLVSLEITLEIFLREKVLFVDIHTIFFTSLALSSSTLTLTSIVCNI